MVIDASIWVSALILEDSNHFPSRQWLDRQVEIGSLLAGPSLLLAEVAAAVARRTGAPELGLRAIDRILRTPGIRLVALDVDTAEAAARSAARLRLRGADAVYAEVARTLQVPLVTWDRELHDRASALITVLTP